MSRPELKSDLLPSELAFVAAIESLCFGRFENLHIRDGELVLDPWPGMVKGLKFGADAPTSRTQCEESPLKRQMVELFEYVRNVDTGEIRTLEIRHGLPFSMEVELTGAITTSSERARRG